MFVALSPVAVDCFFPSSSSDTTAHSDPCLPPSKPYRLLSFSFFPTSPPSSARGQDRRLLRTPSCAPELALMPRYLPLLLILRTTRHLTTQTSVSLFLSLRSYILSLSLASSLSLLALRASVSLISTYVSLSRDPAPTCSGRSSPSRLYIAECTIVTPVSVLHGRRLRRVLCSFRQFNATMSRERPAVRPARQSSRQIYTEIFS